MTPPPPACTCVLTAAAQSTFTLSVFSLCHPRGLPDSCAHCSLATVSMIAHLALGLLLGIAHSIFPFQATQLKPIIKINLWRKSSPPFLFWSLFSCERISSRSSDLWLSLQIHGTSTWELHEGSLHPLQSRHDLLCCGSGLIFWHSRATFPLVFQDRVTPNPGVEKLLSSQKTARPHSTKASVWIMAESKPVLEGSREGLLAPLCSGLTGLLQSPGQSRTVAVAGLCPCCTFSLEGVGLVCSCSLFQDSAQAALCWKHPSGLQNLYA